MHQKTQNLCYCHVAKGRCCKNFESLKRNWLCHFDGSSNIEIGVEYYIYLLWFFWCFLVTAQNWENKILICQNKPWPITIFYQFWVEEEKHNKYSTPILIFDDPPKWHDTHIKVRSFSSYRCINQSSFKRLTNKKAKVWIHAPEKRGNLTSKVFLTKYTLFAYFKIQKKYSKLITKKIEPFFFY